MDDGGAVDGARRGDMFGWARINHEAQVVQQCVKLGAVLLSPSASQEHLTSFAHRPKADNKPGFQQS